MRLVSRGIFIKNKKILLVKAKNRNNYFLPGGGIDVFESAKTALKRELYEELNKDISIENFVGVIENKWKSNNKIKVEINFIFNYTFDISNQEIPISNEENLIFEWIELKDLKSINLQPKCLINIILSNKKTIFASNF